MIRKRTYSADETVEMGRKLGTALQAADIVCLSGNLGTGKTAFTHGLATALGIDGYITSPTFTIVNEYQGRLPLYHFDVYRLGDPEELYDIGFEEYLDAGGVVVIEWADMIQSILPDNHIWVEICKIPGGDTGEREITIDFRGKGNIDRERCMNNESTSS